MKDLIIGFIGTGIIVFAFRVLMWQPSVKEITREDIEQARKKLVDENKKA